MEKVYLSQKEFDELGEYSTSIPTGTTIGKQWKRNCYWHKSHPKYGTLWCLGEYIPDPDPKFVVIVWKEIIIKKPLLTAVEIAMSR